MRRDSDAIGGFFEDLPVLAFVLAGTLSVAGTASWTVDSMSEDAEAEMLRTLAVRLVGEVIAEIRGQTPLPLVETIRCESLEEVLGLAGESCKCAVSVWCLHPFTEPILVASEEGGEQGVSSSARSYTNAICERGIIGVLEVRVTVWRG